MHTFGTRNTVFHFNADFSGLIRIVIDGREFEVPAEDILELVAYEYVLPQRIDNIEQATVQELLR